MTGMKKVKKNSVSFPFHCNNKKPWNTNSQVEVQIKIRQAPLHLMQRCGTPWHKIYNECYKHTWTDKLWKILIKQKSSRFLKRKRLPGTQAVLFPQKPWKHPSELLQIFSHAFVFSHVWAGIPKQMRPQCNLLWIFPQAPQTGCHHSEQAPCPIKHCRARIPRITISKSSLSRTNSECAMLTKHSLYLQQLSLALDLKRLF